MYRNGQYYVSNWVARGTHVRQDFHLLGCLQPDISIWISRRSKASCPPQWGWASLNLLRDREWGTRNLPLFSCLTDGAGTSHLTFSRWTRRTPSVRVVRPLDSDWTALPAFNLHWYDFEQLVWDGTENPLEVEAWNGLDLIAGFTLSSQVCHTTSHGQGHR